MKLSNPSNSKLIKGAFLMILSLFISPVLRAQEITYSPLIILDIFAGSANGEAGGAASGVELNFETRKSVFSVRAVNNNKSVFITTFNYSDFTGTARFEKERDLKELSILYGRKLNMNRTTANLLVGLSTNVYEKWRFENNTNSSVEKSNYFGLPLEANFKWGFPKAKPKSFAGSLGVKAFGNISEKSYAGLGLSLGLGYRK